MWNNLESNYREYRVRFTDRERLGNDLEWLKTIPVKELVRRGIIVEAGDKMETLHRVLQFFRVASVGQWREIWTTPPPCAFRKSAKFRAEPGAVATWLRLGELEAQTIATKPFDKAKFRRALEQVRKLTTQPPEVFQPKIVEWCAEAGVAVVFVPEIRGCPTSGAARWLTPEKALIQLSLRYKSDDQFWFSFFHEAGHVLNGSKKEVFIDDGHDDADQESLANRFAVNFLIPSNRRAEMSGLRSKAAVRAFATSIGIAPGIVVGQLQNSGVIPHSHMNDLKTRLTWKEH
jgi:hypothetical protein